MIQSLYTTIKKLNNLQFCLIYGCKKDKAAYFIFLFLPIFVVGKKIGIREKDPRSARLVTSLCFGAGQAGPGESRGDVNSSERQVFFLFLYVRYSFLLIFIKFGDLSFLYWPMFIEV